MSPYRATTCYRLRPHYVEATRTPPRRAVRAAWSPVDLALWVLVGLAFLILEAVGIVNGNDSYPTFSQMVKTLEHKGLGARLGVLAALAAAFALLVTHWVWPTY